MSRPKKSSGPGFFPILLAVGGLVFLIALGGAIQQARQKGPSVPPWAGLDPWIGQPAPDLEVRDLAGKEWALSEQKGKRVLLVFWATSCMPCLTEIPYLNKLQQEIPSDQLQILALTGDDADYLNKHRVLERFKISYPVISYSGQLGSIVRPYRDVNLLPTLMVISAEGKLEQILIGAREYEDLKKVALGAAGA